MSEGHVAEAKHGGRRRGRDRPKGRQVDPSALAEVRAILGDRSRRRDLLIEHLHLLQDARGHLSAAALAALADEMRLPMAEVYEVATFYAHFDVIREGEPPPAPVTVRVCDSLSCALAGADGVHTALGRALGPETRVLHAPCMGACDCAPAVALGHRLLAEPTAEAVRAALGSDPAVHAPAPQPEDYVLLDACLRGERDAEAVIAALEEAGLRGLGGAGFPTGRKWGLVRRQPKPRYVALNADEGEPGTFKDRWFLEREPRRVLEGLLIAAWAVEAEAVYIYVRDEYPEARAILLDEIAALDRTGRVPPGGLHLRRGAGAYICGEESSMLNSIEGRRGVVRAKPPIPAVEGLFGRPTVVNNVLTLAAVPLILAKGAAFYRDYGIGRSHGTLAFQLAGNVRQGGLVEKAFGVTIREVIDGFGGGTATGRPFRAAQIGGPLGAYVSEAMLDLPLDYEALAEAGAMVGHGGIVVFDDTVDMAEMARFAFEFCQIESCGKCTPCRVGAIRGRETVEKVLRGENVAANIALIEDLCELMRDGSLCAMGGLTPMPVLSAIRLFPEDFDRAPRMAAE